MLSRQARDQIRNPLVVLVWAGCCAWASLTADVLAQPPLLAPPGTQESAVSAEEIEQQLAALERATELDEAARAELRKIYEQALGQLQAAEESVAAAAQFEQMIATAPVTTKQAQAELALQPSEAPEEPPREAPLPQIEKRLAEHAARLAADRTALAELESEIRRRSARRAELPKVLTKLRESKAQLEQDLAAPTPPDLSPAMIAAQRTLRQTRLVALSRQIRAAEKEPEAYEATAELFKLRRDLLGARIPRQEAALKQLQDLVENRSRLEKESQARAARREAAQVHPAVKDLADGNAELAEARAALDRSSQSANEQLTRGIAQLADLQKRFERAQEKIAAIGLSEAVGESLRKERAELPSASAFTGRQDEIRAAHLQLLSLQDRRADLASPSLDEQVKRKVAEIAASAKQLESTEIENAVRDLLQAERDYLDGLIADYDAYFNTLVELDETERQLALATDEYAGFIDERILWIRSSPPLGGADFRTAADAVWWLIDPAAWRDLGRLLLRDVWAYPFAAAAGGGLLLLLLYGQRRLRTKLKLVSQKVQRTSVAPVGQTVQAAGLTVVIALLWPALLGIVGWRLGQAAGDAAFATSISAGLLSAALVLFPLELLRQACRAQGLAEAHFQWPQLAMQQIRGVARTLIVTLTPMAFLVGATERHSGPGRDAPLGRIAFIVAMAAIAWAGKCLLERDSLMVQAFQSRNPQSWLARFRPLWLGLALALPTALIVIAGAGYYYTALQLSGRLNATFYSGLLLAFLNGAILRWVVVARAKLARQQQQERLADQPTSDGRELSATSSRVAGAQIEAQEPDTRKLSEQARQLLRTVLALASLVVLWLIWVDVLPALGVLRRVELWSVSVTSSELLPSENETLTTQVVTRLRPITLADLSLALLVLVMMIGATRNFPGMLEMFLLRRLPLDAGARYATTTLARYVILLVGLVLFAALVGLSWSSVQWLVAAVTVGLGFGLQEIFANFVSGLILLFERPMRVGDIVTVDGVTGVVSKIQMRATTITNWDRQEYVVPNKEFITGRLLNWTLTNQVNRIVINVNLAYGSDTERAHQVLTEVVTAHPLVMSDPGPLISFEGFGENALNFVVRCYLPDMDNRLKTIHELHTRIDQALRRAGLEIALPRRDLRIHSVEGVFSVAGAPAESNGPTEHKGVGASGHDETARERGARGLN